MVWESQSVCIVMTTRCVERRTIKCGRYWPNLDEGSDTEIYENISVTVKVSRQSDGVASIGTNCKFTFPKLKNWVESMWPSALSPKRRFHIADDFRSFLMPIAMTGITEKNEKKLILETMKRL